MKKIKDHKNKALARIETRLSVEQKELFLKAAELSGYNTLTDFILSTLREKAEGIIEKKKQILTSERDKEIFFSTLEHSDGPNEALIEAAKWYNQTIDEIDD